jgi:hypothetical protein
MEIKEPVPNAEESCVHEFAHLDTSFRTHPGGYNTEYIRIDYFFCRKCLEQKEHQRREYAKEPPDWFRRR